jgi:hypothetical protein
MFVGCLPTMRYLFIDGKYKYKKVAKFYPLQLLFEHLSSYSEITCFLHLSFKMAAPAHRPQGRKLLFFIRVTTQTTYLKIITTPYFVRQPPFFSPTDWTMYFCRNEIKILNIRR